MPTPREFQIPRGCAAPLYYTGRRGKSIRRRERFVQFARGISFGGTNEACIATRPNGDGKRHRRHSRFSSRTGARSIGRSIFLERLDIAEELAKRVSNLPLVFFSGGEFTNCAEQDISTFNYSVTRSVLFGV